MVGPTMRNVFIRSFQRFQEETQALVDILLQMRSDKRKCFITLMRHRKDINLHLAIFSGLAAPDQEIRNAKMIEYE